MSLNITREVEVPADDPFRYDVLGFKESAEQLTRLVRVLPGPATVAIDGPWGCGKTTFLRMWTAEMARQQGQGLTAVYFSAWASQQSGPPLAALVAEVQRRLSELGVLGDSRARLVERAARAARAMAPAIVRGMAERVLGEGTIGEIAETLAREEIEMLGARRDETESFRQELADLASRVAPQPPLVIAVDELDRCRPSYAVHFLEVVEHLFSVPGVVFMFGINKVQLAHSLNGAHGEAFDSRGYLRRFIDIEFTLPKPTSDGYLRSLFDAYNLAPLLRDMEGVCFMELRELAEWFDLSLRDLRQIVQRFHIAAHQGLFGLFDFIPFLLVLRHAMPEAYERVRLVERPGAFIDEVAQRLGRPGFSERRRSWRHEAVLLAGLLAKSERNGRARFEEYRQATSDRGTAVAEMADDIPPVRLDDYLGCVEFAMRFNFPE